MEKRDPYMMLGVRPIDKPEDIKRSYRELSKKFHPDMNKGHEEAAAIRMKELVSAHDVLNDRQKRDDYDNQAMFKPRPSKRMAKSSVKHMSQARQKEKVPGFWDKLIALAVVKGPPKPNPEAANSHFTMGMTMVDNTAFYDQARSEFAEAARNDPQFFEAVYNQALMAYKLGLWEEARAGFRKAIEVKDDRGARMILELIEEVVR